ncbi:alpha-lytic protease prodomain-containing protein, partial [Streptomyces clavifer]
MTDQTGGAHGSSVAASVGVGAGSGEPVGQSGPEVPGSGSGVGRHSMRRLRSATQDLGRAPRVPGTAWAVDYAS